MKKSYIILSLLVIFSNSHLIAQNLNWAFASADFNVGGGDMVEDHSGNILMTGTLCYSNDFDPGPLTQILSSNGSYSLSDAFIAKYTPNGNLINAIKFGGQGTDYGLNIHVDQQNNIFISGQFIDSVDFDPGPGQFMMYSLSPNYGSVYILKLDSNFNFIWAKAFQGLNSTYNPFNLLNSEIGSDNNIYMTGSFYGTVDFDPGSSNYIFTSVTPYSNTFILKMDYNGNMLWVKTMNPSVYGKIVLDDNLNIYIASNFSGNVDYDPGPAVFNLSSAGGGSQPKSDIAIAKYDSLGNFIWAKQIGGNYNENVSTPIIHNGNILLGGIFGGSVDFDPGPSSYVMQAGTNFWNDGFVMSIDTGGNFNWAKQFHTHVSATGPGYNGISAFKYDAWGNLYISGGLSDTVDVDPGLGVYTLYSKSFGCYLLKFDTQLNLISANILGNDSSTVGIGKLINSGQSLVCWGSFGGAFDCDFSANSVILSSDTTNFARFFLMSLNFNTTALENKFDDNSIVVFPNPASQKINIHFNNPEDESSMLQMFNITGEVVLKKEIQGKPGISKINLDVSTFRAGIYTLNVITSNQTFSQKIIVF